VFLTRYDDVATMYRSPSASSDKKREFGPKYGEGTPLYEHHTGSLVFNDPPSHTRVRRLLLGAVNQRAIARMEPGVVALVDGLLDAMAERAAGGVPLDLIEDFAAAIPVEVIGNLLSFPHEARGPLRGWSLAILAALEPAPTSAMLEAGNRAVTDFVAYLKDLIAHRRAHPLDPDSDVLTRLIQGERTGEKLSEVELLQNCVFLLNAGHETTTNLIGNALLTLQEFPAARDKLLTDMGRHAGDAAAHEAVLTLAVDEFLRFESSNQLGNRRALKASEVGGVALDEGALVTLCIGAANRDPAQYASPETLDLCRENNKHLAFGFGIHQCAGLSLARLEGRIAVGRFLQRFPGYRLSSVPMRGGRARFRGFLNAPFRVD
jgi:hypothetical protein